MSRSKDKKAKKSLYPGFKLRMQLFRIWFMKNILVWIQVFCITCIVCMLTGNITASTPILGKIIYPLFQPLVDEINVIVDERRIDNLMDFFAIIISILTSIGIFTMKVRGIAQSDIKTDKLKIALIQANLYFNSDGKLVKKTEKMVGRDLDGDGKISDTNEEPQVTNGGLFKGIFTAIREFFTIATVDLSGTEEESQEKFENIMEETNYKEREEGTREVKKSLKKGVTLMALDGIENNLDKKMDAKLATAENIEEEAKIRRNFFSLKNLLKKKKKEVIEKEDEIIINNVDKDAVVEKKDNAAEALKSVKNEPAKGTTQKSGGSAADALASLRK